MTVFVPQEELIETLKNQIITACKQHAPVVIQMLMIGLEKNFFYPVIECIPGLELDDRLLIVSINKAILLASLEMM